MLDTIEIRIYYEDTDAQGVVFYANYLKYFERGRTEFLRNCGYLQNDLLKKNIIFVNTSKIQNVDPRAQSPHQIWDVFLFPYCLIDCLLIFY